MRYPDPAPNPCYPPLADELDPVGNGLDAPLRIRDGDDVVAVVPYLLGFQPHESIVALVFRDRRLITTVRFPLAIGDVPAELHRRIWAISQQFPGACWVLVAYSDDRSAAVDTVEAMTLAIGAEAVFDSLYVNDGRYWSLGCPDRFCCPAEGRLIDTSGSPVAMRAVVAGLQVLGSREEIDKSIRPPRGWLARAAMGRLDTALAEIRTIGLDEIAQQFEDLVERGLEDPAGLSEKELAMMAASACYPSARDRALLKLTRAEARRHVELWRVVARATPRGSQAPVLGLLGMAAWVSGDGALQMVCLERGEKIAPEHALIGLLADINRLAAPPMVWERLLADKFGSDRQQRADEVGRPHAEAADQHIAGNRPPGVCPT